MSRDPLPPILLSEVRALGFPIFVSCPICNHSGRVAGAALAGMPGDMTVHDIGHAVRCTSYAARRRERAAVGRALASDRTASPPALLDADDARGGGRGGARGFRGEGGA